MIESLASIPLFYRFWVSILRIDIWSILRIDASILRIDIYRFWESIFLLGYLHNHRFSLSTSASQTEIQVRKWNNRVTVRIYRKSSYIYQVLAWLSNLRIDYRFWESISILRIDNRFRERYSDFRLLQAYMKLSIEYSTHY